MKSMTLKIKKRCIFCRKVLRADGTCQNPECPRYTPPKDETKDNTDEKSE